MVSIRFRFAIGLTWLAVLLSIAIIGDLATSASKTSAAQASADDAPRIKPEEVRELLRHNKAVLVDVRPQAAFTAGHVKGALNIPYAEIRDRGKELPRDKMIVTYCS